MVWRKAGRVKATFIEEECTGLPSDVFVEMHGRPDYVDNHRLGVFRTSIITGPKHVGRSDFAAEIAMSAQISIGLPVTQGHLSIQALLDAIKSLVDAYIAFIMVYKHNTAFH